MESQTRNSEVLAFKRELAGLAVTGGRDRGFMGRVRGWFSVRRRTVVLTDQVEDLVRETNLQIAAILRHLKNEDTRGLRTADDFASKSQAAVSAWSTSYANDDLAQTLDEVLRKVRAEVASMKKN